MQKVVVGIILVLLAVFAIKKFFFSNAEAGKDAPRQQAFTISKNSEAFNRSFEKLLNG